MDCIWVYTSVRDEEHLMPFFLRHYMSFADKVFVEDCGSKDSTKDIVRSAGAELIEDEPWGMDEDRRRNDAEVFVREARDKAEWCICPDADEFVLGQFGKAFDAADEHHFDVLHTTGCTMLGPGFPKDDGRQIYDTWQMGTVSGASKPIVVRGGAHFRWSLGKHFIETPETKVGTAPLYLLHYRYMGKDYTKHRNAKNWKNSPDKGTAWACDPDWRGEGSADHIAKRGEDFGVNVVEWIRSLPSAPYAPAAYAPHLVERNASLIT